MELRQCSKIRLQTIDRETDEEELLLRRHNHHQHHHHHNHRHHCRIIVTVNSITSALGLLRCPSGDVVVDVGGCVCRLEDESQASGYCSWRGAACGLNG